MKATLLFLAFILIGVNVDAIVDRLIESGVLYLLCFVGVFVLLLLVGKNSVSREQESEETMRNRYRNEL